MWFTCLQLEESKPDTELPDSSGSLTETPGTNFCGSPEVVLTLARMIL